MINVVNKRTHRPTPNDIYIGRGSGLGNPYTHKRVAQTQAQYQCTSREEAIQKYQEWLSDQIDNGNQTVVDMLNRILAKAKDGDVNLVCYCAPQACHGDVIKAYVEERIT